jgi:Na+/melibiose symporter-like transporter
MSPVFGLLVDKTGKNILWVLCAVATTLVSHMMLAFTMWNPWIAMVTSFSTWVGRGFRGLNKSHVRGHIGQPEIVVL